MDTQKLLYLLPDVAYEAELIPGKKEHTFVVHAFRQINGEFIDDNEFIHANVAKLFTKLKAETYQLILPDFLFTNTIVEIEEKSEAKVKEYIKQTLLPDLTLSSKTHVLKPFILNQYGNKSRIQLSAIEKSLLAPVVKGAKDLGATITSIVPISWTAKSLISLEPSISVIQLGERGYLALHYIGVDQTHDASIQDIDTLAETIKTLKGAEPSIQTVYLLTNELIEEKIKENLDGIVPVQQLTSAKNESEMPSYVQQAIEAGMKSLSISEYAVPTFSLPSYSDIEPFLDEQTNTTDTAGQSEIDTSSDIEPITELETSETTKTDEQPDKTAITQEVREIKEISLDDEDDELHEDASNQPKTNSTEDDEKEFVKEKEEKELEDKDVEKKVEEKLEENKSFTQSSTSQNPVIDLTKEASNQTSDLNMAAVAAAHISDLPDSSENAIVEKATPIIKNQSAIAPMLNMFFIGLSVFFATIGIGIAVGASILGINMFAPFGSSNETQLIQPVDEIETETIDEMGLSLDELELPNEEPSFEPEPFQAETISLLIVNATTKAGYAGQIQRSLNTIDFKTVDARNARGEYEPGIYLLVNDSFELTAELQELLEQELDLTLIVQTDILVEDSTKTYDAIIVLAE